MKNIKISLMFMFFVAILIAFDNDGWMAVILISAAIHEAGHIVAITILGGKIKRFDASMAGCKITYTAQKQTSYFTDVILAFSGPMSNLIAASAAIFMPQSENMFYFIGTNILLGIMNLLPVSILDGGRIAYALLAQRQGVERADVVCKRMSAVACAIIIVVSGAVLILSRFSMGLLMAGIVILFSLCDKIALQKTHIHI